MKITEGLNGEYGAKAIRKLLEFRQFAELAMASGPLLKQQVEDARKEARPDRLSEYSTGNGPTAYIIPAEHPATYGMKNSEVTAEYAFQVQANPFYILVV